MGNFTLLMHSGSAAGLEKVHKEFLATERGKFLHAEIVEAVAATVGSIEAHDPHNGGNLTVSHAHQGEILK